MVFTRLKDTETESFSFWLLGCLSCRRSGLLVLETLSSDADTRINACIHTLFNNTYEALKATNIESNEKCISQQIKSWEKRKLGMTK